MKKFTGKVNGKSFDNEKDFNEAVAEVLKTKPDNLTISSYYYEEDERDDVALEDGDVLEDDDVCELEEPEDLGKKEDYSLSKEDYFLSSDAAPTAYKGKLDYDFSTDLADKIRNASNQDEIRTSTNGKLGYLGKKIKELSEKSAGVEKEISKLQSELYDIETELKDSKAQKRYYNSIIDVLDKTDECEECDCDCDCESTINVKPTVRVRSFNPFYYFLKNIGFWDF